MVRLLFSFEDIFDFYYKNGNSKKVGKALRENLNPIGAFILNPSGKPIS
jgi:hypothetical protein